MRFTFVIGVTTRLCRFRVFEYKSPILWRKSRLVFWFRYRKPWRVVACSRVENLDRSNPLLGKFKWLNMQLKHGKKTKGHFTENSNIIMAQELEQIQRKLMLNPEQIPSKHDSASCFG